MVLTCGDCENFLHAPTSKYGICPLLGIYTSEDSQRPLTCHLFKRKKVIDR
ncbi:hypothetical protein [Candidatus Methanodesulfokora washburnensis]|uniref:hypothetical protein n=1 Tax=Candidatus Methanodesulfokora washburnensis TaxID=2478471 RepID=UPI0013871B3B|nr:hypothetical protein [Candidatus Methanodesulfokores washburnensis]